jgi:succinoglycan biosynthesis protein ExoA
MNPAPETDQSGLPAEGPSPFLSIVLPIKNESRFIRQTLTQLLEQDYPADRYELLVCDGRSDDDTRTIVEQMAAADPRIRLLDNPGQRSSAGRNVGFKAARGDFVVVVDGHVQLAGRSYLANVARCFRESGADCLGRPQPLRAEEPGGFAEAICLTRRSWLGHSPSSFINSDHEGFAPAASMGAGYRKEVFGTIGYVDENFDACEDLEFNTRLDKAGLKCFTSPTLTVHYYARNSARALFKQMHRYGFGRYKYLVKHPDMVSPSQLAPPALVLGLLTLPLLALLYFPLFLLGWGVTMLYLGIIILASLDLARQTTWRHFLRYVQIFPVIHIGLGWGFLASLLKRGRIGKLAEDSIDTQGGGSAPS